MAFDISKFAATLDVDVSESDTQMQQISLDRISTNPRNFYPAVSPEEQSDLEASIVANGLLEPLTVVPVPESPGFYRLISGHNRFRALRSIRATHPGREQWATAACLVLPAMSEHQEVSAIIEANRQRRKTSALLADEAEKLTRCYVARKAAGEDLPGRIREWVAAALHVSQTKLATIKAIKKNLKVPGFKRAWEEDKLPEAVAYEISKLETEAQYRLLDFQIDSHETLSIRTVKQFGTAWISCRHKCEHTGRFCENAMRMVRGCTGPDGWHCAGCCAGCLRRSNCPYVCEYCKPQPTTEEKPAEVPEWQRQREAFGSWENGCLPGSDRLLKLARTLGVSTDYLYGLSDNPHGVGAKQDAAVFNWQPLDEAHWPCQGDVVILRGATRLDGLVYQAARCQDGPQDSLVFEDACGAFDLDEDDMSPFSEWALLEGHA